jgi:hypothetical protein
MQLPMIVSSKVTNALQGKRHASSANSDVVFATVQKIASATDTKTIGCTA